MLTAKVKRAHIVVPAALVAEIDALMGKRARSSFMAEAAQKELMRLRQIKALKAATGAWKDIDHPELKGGTNAWVRKLRHESNRRLPKLPAR